MLTEAKHFTPNLVGHLENQFSVSKINSFKKLCLNVSLVVNCFLKLLISYYHPIKADASTAILSDTLRSEIRFQVLFLFPINILQWLLRQHHSIIIKINCLQLLFVFLDFLTSTS